MIWKLDPTFDDIKVGNIVKIVDYYDKVAVGIVIEKKETRTEKSIGVQFGFLKTLENVIVEELEPSSGTPMEKVASVLKEDE